VFSGVAWKYRPQHYPADGLNTVRYKLESAEHRPLYTWLYVTLPHHPAHFTGSYRAGQPSNGFYYTTVDHFHLYITIVLCFTNHLLHS